MISGIVNSAREAVISIEILGASGSRIVETIIDTGFTDYLTLPASIINELGLPIDSVTRVTLADNLSSVVNVYLAEINWATKTRTIQVLEMTGDPLVGMALLHRHHLHVHIIDGGQVLID